MYTVLIIEDSLSMRNMISDIINKLDSFEVIATANDAYEARDKIKQYEPDLVTIDLNMPKMNGTVFLKNLMKLHPMPAIVISSYSNKQEELVSDGALGFIEKPKIAESLALFRNRIIDTLNGICFLLKKYKLKKPKPSLTIKINKKKQIKKDTIEIEHKIHPDKVLKSNPCQLSENKIIAIGSSTGGINALINVFEKLNNNLPPILITQHIPYTFSASFANRLNNHSKINVAQAQDGDILKKGYAYLAPGNMHLTIVKMNNKFIVKLLDEQKVSRHKPSVDILFRSVNNVIGKSAMAIMMTGMGDDGSIGMKELYDNGAYTIAQNEESCVVFGMPKMAINNGAVKDVCHLDDIAQYITEFSQNKRR
jgi:two-component system chemotaxis response regulator CheB